MGVEDWEVSNPCGWWREEILASTLSHSAGRVADEVAGEWDSVLASIAACYVSVTRFRRLRRFRALAALLSANRIDRGGGQTGVEDDIPGTNKHFQFNENAFDLGTCALYTVKPGVPPHRTPFDALFALLRA